MEEINKNITYRVVLISNGVYKKTLHRSRTKPTIFKNYHRIKEENEKVMFPKRFINTGSIKPVKFEVMVVKDYEEGDKLRTVRDELGKTHEEPLLGGNWTILASDKYEVEETFWIYGRDSKKNRPTIHEIVRLLMIDIDKKRYNKQIVIVHNKLIINSEEQFDMVLCKCKDDAQRLHHLLAKKVKKLKIKNLLFMGTASEASVSMLYDLIQENTGWDRQRVKRRNTRP
jgi:hypothetical protein